MNPPLLELTEFCDKRDLSKKLVKGNRRKFRDDLAGLGTLRDQLAHAGTFIGDATGASTVAVFVDRFENARHWISELTNLTEERGRK